MRTLCPLGVWACEGEKVLMQRGLLSAPEREALHEGNASAFACSDVDWRRAFAEFDAGWEKSRAAQAAFLATHLLGHSESDPPPP